MARARHIDGHAGQQVDVVAFFQLVHTTLELARVQGHRPLALGRAAGNTGVGALGQEVVFRETVESRLLAGRHPAANLPQYR